MKMETPKMDVVRFQEADVIVASNGLDKKLATLAGWGDGTSGNATLTFTDGNGQNATVHPYSEIHQDSEIYNLWFINNNNDSVNLSAMANDENSYSEFNGHYERKADGKYYWQ